MPWLMYLLSLLASESNIIIQITNKNVMKKITIKRNKFNLNGIILVFKALILLMPSFPQGNHLLLQKIIQQSWYGILGFCSREVTRFFISGTIRSLNVLCPLTGLPKIKSRVAASTQIMFTAVEWSSTTIKWLWCTFCMPQHRIRWAAATDGIRRSQSVFQNSKSQLIFFL